MPDEPDEPDVTETATALELDIADRILAFAHGSRLPVGAHLTEAALSAEFGVSRTPVRGALNLLKRRGHVERIANRGYFLTADVSRMQAPEIRQERQSDLIYEGMIGDYLGGRLEGKVSEAHLLRRYNADRPALVEALARLQAEGIIRANPGYGWQFEDLLRTLGASDESQHFRLILEPAGLRQPTFRIDRKRLLACKKEQTHLLQNLSDRTRPSDIFAASVRFHELLAELSGNRFILQAIQQQSRTRRLVDYRSYQDLERVRSFYREHVAMIDLVLEGRMEEAAILMEKHILDVVHFKPGAFSATTSGNP